MHYAFAQTNQTALNRIEAANTAIEQAFNAVLDAEKAGASVTGLLPQLNNAERILAQAENSYRTEDFNAAQAQANSAIPIAQKVTTVAQSAKQTALASSKNAFWSTIAITLIGVLVFVLGLFLVWRMLKRRYIKTLLGAKPEVTDLEA